METTASSSSRGWFVRNGAPRYVLENDEFERLHPRDHGKFALKNTSDTKGDLHAPTPKAAGHDRLMDAFKQFHSEQPALRAPAPESKPIQERGRDSLGVLKDYEQGDFTHELAHWIADRGGATSLQDARNKAGSMMSQPGGDRTAIRAKVRDDIADQLGHRWADLEQAAHAFCKQYGHTPEGATAVHEAIGIVLDAYSQQVPDQKSAEIRLGMQRAVADVRGILSGEKVPAPGKHAELLRAVAGAIYDNTQNRLEDAHVDGMLLYRAVDLTHRDADFDALWNAGSDRTGHGITRMADCLTVKQAPLSAWSTSYDEAFNHAWDKDRYAIVGAWVPKEQIFSLPISGMGRAIFNEVYIAGAPEGHVRFAVSREAGHSGAMHASAAAFWKHSEPSVAKWAAESLAPMRRACIEVDSGDFNWIAETFDESKVRRDHGKFAPLGKKGIVPHGKDEVAHFLHHEEHGKVYLPDTKEEYDRIPAGHKWMDTDFGDVEQKKSSAPVNRGPSPQASAVLGEIRQRLPKDYKAWLRETEATDDADGMAEYLEEKHGVRVRDDGLVHFDHLTPAVRKIVGNAPIVLYHHTSDAVLGKIQKGGLRPAGDGQVAVNPHLNSKSGVYVTTQSSGPVVEGYGGVATAVHGGNATMLQIRTTIDQLRDDPDDAELGWAVGRQFILPKVEPKDIVNLRKGKVVESGAWLVLNGCPRFVLEAGSRQMHLWGPDDEAKVHRDHGKFAHVEGSGTEAPKAESAPKVEQPEPPRFDSEGNKIGRSQRNANIVFATPIKGPSGAELSSYEWKHQLFEEVGKDDELHVRRVSDWEESETNQHTGREVVHHFHVKDKDGTHHVVSLETALELLGYTKKDKSFGADKVREIGSAVKSRAKAQMDLDRKRDTFDRYAKAVDEARAKVDKLPLPPITIDEDTSDNRQIALTVNMGDEFQMVRLDHNPDTTSAYYHRQERITYAKGQVVRAWKNRRLDEMVSPDLMVEVKQAFALSGRPSQLPRTNLTTELDRAQKRIDKLDAKIAAITEPHQSAESHWIALNGAPRWTGGPRVWETRNGAPIATKSRSNAHESYRVFGDAVARWQVRNGAPRIAWESFDESNVHSCEERQSWNPSSSTRNSNTGNSASSAANAPTSTISDATGSVTPSRTESRTKSGMESTSTRRITLETTEFSSNAARLSRCPTQIACESRKSWETRLISEGRWTVRNGAPRIAWESFDESKVHRDHGKFAHQEGAGGESSEPEKVHPHRTPEFRAKLHATEDELRLKKDREHGVIWGPNGDKLLEVSGTEECIDIPEEHYPLLDGACMAHSHCKGWRFPEDNPQSRGNSFSREDIMLAVAYGAREVRAVTPAYRHTLEVGDGFIAAQIQRISGQDFGRMMLERERAAGRTDRQIVWEQVVEPREKSITLDLRGKLQDATDACKTEAEARKVYDSKMAEFQHEKMLKLRDLFGWHYTRERHPLWQFSDSTKASSTPPPVSSASDADTSTPERKGGPARHSQGESQTTSGTRRTITPNHILETTAFGGKNAPERNERPCPVTSSTTATSPTRRTAETASPASIYSTSAAGASARHSQMASPMKSGTKNATTSRHTQAIRESNSSAGWYVRNGSPRFIGEAFDESHVHRDHGKFAKTDVAAEPKQKAAQIRAGAIPEKPQSAEPTTEQWNAKFDQWSKLAGGDPFDLLFQIPSEAGRAEQMAWMERKIAEGRADPKVQAWERATNAIKKTWDLQLRQSVEGGVIGEEHATAYRTAAHSVLEHMNHECASRLAANLAGAVFYRDQDKLTERFAEKDPDVAYMAKRGGKLGGVCETLDVGKHRLHLDGGPNDTKVRHFYAHEMAHSVDQAPIRQQGEFKIGGGHISDTRPWIEAWREEINHKTEPLSRYARTSASEGFAEFGRLVWSGRRPSEIKAKFPKCWKVWEDYGLVDKAA